MKKIPSSNSNSLDNIIDEENAALTVTPVALKSKQSATLISESANSSMKNAPATSSTKQLIIESTPTVVTKPVAETESAV